VKCRKCGTRCTVPASGEKGGPPPGAPESGSEAQHQTTAAADATQKADTEELPEAPQKSSFGNMLLGLSQIPQQSAEIRAQRQEERECFLPVLYASGGSFGLKPPLEGALIMEEEAMVFHASEDPAPSFVTLIGREVFRIPYAAVKGASLGFEKSPNPLKDLPFGVGPLWDDLTRHITNLLKVEFEDDIGTCHYVIFKTNMRRHAPVEEVERRLKAYKAFFGSRKKGRRNL
jgi:hypothetical protein